MNSWKVIYSDNFGMSGEMPSRDEGFAMNYPVKQSTAETIAHVLNSEEATDFGPHYFKAVPEDYKPAVLES